MEKKKKIKLISSIAFAAIFAGLMLFLFWGENFLVLKELFGGASSGDELRAILAKLGIRGYATIAILSTFQVVLAFLPAEPVQVVAGVAYGFWRGVGVCTAGVFFGNTLIYLLYKIYGEKLADFFEKSLPVDFDTVMKPSVLAMIVFILYFLPAIPYGLICFFTATAGLKYGRYILYTLLGSIPSIMIGVGLGNMAIAQSWIVSVAVFFVLVALLLLAYKYKDFLFKKVSDFVEKRNAPYSSSVQAKKYDPTFYRVAAFFQKLFYRPAKITIKNSVGKLERPAIVLCTHGSFIDFLYAGQLLKKENPHYVTARLYFYKKSLARVLKQVGCFPKSMFSNDFENVKNCVRVLSDGGVLVMMPEARLSTVGKFEGIQPQTFKFIRKMNAAVYTLNLKGSYFTKPKWADGVRKGSVVEGELLPLFKLGETRNLSIEEIEKRVNEAMDYDEWKWLDSHPEIEYRSKTIAVGLENILTLCPECNAAYSMKTEGNKISCEKCGFTREVGSRYEFTNPEPFENFAEWYEWRTAKMDKEIVNNPEFKLEQAVTLMHASKDGKTMLREAGKGVCTLRRSGLAYVGERDGETVEKFFPATGIYRILFGSGEDFELYQGSEIYYFRPEEKRSCVDWYIASVILEKRFGKEND